ncbi:bacterial proteasome activator family protein [Actinotalea sp. AC32]|nr:bacterial proteasome activator family protein [Actinotalea sp. AC32]
MSENLPRPADDDDRDASTVPGAPDSRRGDPADPADPADDVAGEGSSSGRGRVPVPDSLFSGSPAKVMRIGTMVKQLLEEVRSAPLDEAARGRLAEVHDRSLRELEDGLSDDLVAELRRITLPFSDDGNPSDAELRVAQAQLVGWLEGLFHGLQTALVAQQMSTQAQLAQMRRALPPGSLPPGAAVAPAGAEPGAGPVREERHPGQYL